VREESPEVRDGEQQDHEHRQGQGELDQ
jgi:hypothetical protein